MVDAQNAESARDPRAPEGQVPTEVRLVAVRRAPNIAAFILTGVVLGFILGAVVNQFGPFGGAESFPFQVTYSETTSLLYLGTVGALLGGGIGALAAVLLDRQR